MDVVRCDIEIAAPIERVWDALTDPAQIEVWYAFDGAAVDLTPGGLLEHRWDEHGRFFGVIDVLEPPARFGYRYSTSEDVLPEPGVATHVRFDLQALSPDRTRLQVTESGIESLAISAEEQVAYREITTQAWSGSLVTLAEHLQD